LVSEKRYNNIPSAYTGRPTLFSNILRQWFRRRSMGHLPSEPNQFRAAEQAAKRGQRAAAYQLLCQVLIENPRYLPAWLSMSKLVDDPARQRECLERVLVL